MTDYKVPITTGLGSETDALKTTAGVITAIGSPVKNYALLYNGTAPVWAAQGTTFTFSINAFIWSGYASIIEMGVASSEWKAVGALSFTATYHNGPPDATPYISKTSPEWDANLEMTEEDYVGPTLNAEVVDYPAAVNGYRQFALYAESGDENETQTLTTYFRNKKYFGFDSTDGVLDSDKTIALSDNAFVTASASNLDTSATVITPSGSQYIHFVYPNRISTTIKFYLGGFETEFTDNGTFEFTNASGFTETYRDFQSPNPYDEEVSLVVDAS